MNKPLKVGFLVDDYEVDHYTYELIRVCGKKRFV